VSGNDDSGRRMCTEFALIGRAANKVRLRAVSASEIVYNVTLNTTLTLYRLVGIEGRCGDRTKPLSAERGTTRDLSVDDRNLPHSTISPLHLQSQTTNLIKHYKPWASNLLDRSKYRVAIGGIKFGLGADHETLDNTRHFSATVHPDLIPTFTRPGHLFKIRYYKSAEDTASLNSPETLFFLSRDFSILC
jgi:hypothetical protein